VTDAEAHSPITGEADELWAGVSQLLCLVLALSAMLPEEVVDDAQPTRRTLLPATQSGRRSHPQRQFAALGSIPSGMPVVNRHT
jgi:hypothetical protein